MDQLEREAAVTTLQTQIPRPPSSAIAVANFFLDLGAQDQQCPPIDQMKLQKLVFYAQAWHLARRGTALFAEDVEAWPWGPVVRSLYVETRKYGRGPVPRPLRELRFDPSVPLQSRFVIPEVADPAVAEFLREVWEAHKPYTGIQLSNSTHAPGEPWTIIAEQYGALDTKPLIPNDLIAAVFGAKLAGQHTAA